ncbi:MULTISPECIES: helix-turn-helix transcriptional regulator [unclassified Acetobacterium]|jgi:predicted DNA-binding transcriptional regulator YafY|uniref:helix-turn-helix transcriptional regulator n=1 Tax=unclassified Acetobacterium TaxID=2638182 RepID=UPI000DBEC97D|nr:MULTISPECIES: WYL domain-containing protein [unclassified Acetobacterium]AWW27725.1 WYL domain-containing protein [Acetobacterium sp. KB-1]MDZ5725933.1 WYL domain-containing protein [Acetobacterium sp. K1/6]
MTSQHDEKKTARILAIYDQIIRGETVNKQKWAENLGVSDKTIQRDLKEIEDYLQVLYPESKVAYDRKCQGHRLFREGSMALSDNDIFAVIKVLLDARPFNKKEMGKILDHLLCLSYNRKAIELAIGNERQHYQPVKHDEDLIERIWFFSQSVQNHQVLGVQYQKQDGTVKAYKINPLGLLFNEYYFYVIAEINGKENPVSLVFRLDRFLNYAFYGEDQRFTVDYGNRFQESEFRDQIQFMYTGELTTIRFRFSGPSLEAVRDRLPTAKVEKTEDGVTTLSARVYGEGVKKWLLSQGDWVEVLSPPSYRKEMVEMIERMRGKYGEE